MRTALIAASLLVATVLAPRAADADDATTAAMNDYFAGEKRGGLVLVGMGAVGLGAGGLLATRDSDVAKGAGYATLGIGAVHVAAGVFVYVASNGRIEEFTDEISSDGDGFRVREQKRVAGVQRQFFALKIVEGVLIVGGGGAAIVGLSSDRDLLAGIGLGIAAEAAATLIFDIVAARRAGRYRRALESIGTLGIRDSRGGVAPGLGIRLVLQ